MLILLLDSHLKLPLLQRKEYLEFLSVVWAPALTNRRHRSIITHPAEASSGWSSILTAASVPSSNIPPQAPDQEDDLENHAAILDPNISHVETAEDLDPGDTSESDEVVDVQETLNEGEDEDETTAINVDTLNLTFAWETRVSLHASLCRLSSHCVATF